MIDKLKPCDVCGYVTHRPVYAPPIIELNINIQVNVCPDCNGDRLLPNIFDQVSLCPTCSGSGLIVTTTPTPSPPHRPRCRPGRGQPVGR